MSAHSAKSAAQNAAQSTAQNTDASFSQQGGRGPSAPAPKSFLSRLLARFRGLKLRTQLLLSFLLSSLLVLALASLFLYVNLLDMLQKRNEETTVRSFRQIERSLLDFQLTTDSLSKLYVVNANLDAFLKDTSTDSFSGIQTIRELQETMALDVNNTPFLHAIFVVANDGRFIGVTESTSYVGLQPASVPFHTSVLYREAFEGYPRLSWKGGMRSAALEATVVSERQAGRDVPIITASRVIRPVYLAQSGGTLVFSLLESAVYENFGALAQDEQTTLVLMDEEGVIVSATDKGKVGTHESDLDEMTEPFGSFIRERDERREQYIYYRVSSGWILGMQQPLSIFMADIYTLRYTLLLMLLICFLVGGAFSLWWTRKLTKPIYALLAGMRNLKQGQLGVQVRDVSSSELGIAVEEFNRMSHSIESLVEENRRIEQSKKLAELKALQSQINPHFLFNTLNTIKWMAIGSQATPIAETITSLGNLIRPIYKSAVPLVPLREELAYVEDYLKIMNVRYGGGIDFTVQVAPAFEEVTVPRLIVQPIIENALVHGLESAGLRGSISITSASDGEDMLLHVRDNGSGIPPDKLAAVLDKLGDPGARDSVGLANVHQRLQLHFGPPYGIAIQSGSDGTCVTLRMPVVQKS